MTAAPRVENTRAGKAELRYATHNRRPGGRADMRTITWRSWRRAAKRRFREMKGWTA